MPRFKRLKYGALANHALQTWENDLPAVVAVDTETVGVAFYDHAFCGTVAWRTSSGVQSHYFELQEYDASEQLSRILRDTPKLIFHNAKFDLQKLILPGIIGREQVSPNRVEDTETLAYLTNEHWDKHLKVLAHRLLGLETDEAKVLKKARERIKKERKLRYLDEVRYHMIPRHILYPYALKDAEFTLLLWEYLRPGIGAFPELEQLYAHEIELALAVLDVEAAGMSVRLDYVDEKVKEYNRRILEQEFIIGDLTELKVWYPERQGQTTPEGCYNPNSWQQLLAELNAAGIYPKGTDKKTLATLDHPLAAATVELRECKKTLNTYLLGIKAEQRDGIIHPWFNISRVVSGRFSSSKADDG